MVVTITDKYFIHDLRGITKQETIVNFGATHKNAGYIVHRAYVAQATQLRQGTRGTKTKAEVQGGGKKPWKQKGTGRARAGSNRSPLWRGGGVIFGPRYQHYRKKINKKEKAIALQACLQNRLENIKVISNFVESFSKPNTKLILQILGKWEVNMKDKVLIITKEHNKNLYLSIRNIPNVTIIVASQLNVLSVLLANTILVSIDAIPIISYSSKGI
uniref:Large ribosomal subunit protein uL4c n=1 Tax=Hildenbrandia rubra TaxID=31481 RepID=A0A1C9CGC0_9FLOR|nr:ribosomal protein L4 [Hildenbrandia rubra]AOM67433.1 ribosomal protein L4 [Hildenbrandia rubra]|eukprot:Plantae.Rhodophyta-Hildenbrandia_rubra.ctg107.p1 GENE.Plantae.Rhodophyta-Hildenbrandia_rubra.ctg107~~Plantae.Rhodophyta-Hildenbrandia_rubra.ctg107.p1  ORF type:complete len:216 (+),score=6.54 Plantae.Rhodophyta-Hildenbrandia_rubra.ctg107:851-1498(+)